MALGKSAPELIILLEVEDELSSLAQVVFLLTRVWTVAIHRALYILSNHRSRWERGKMQPN